MVRGGGVDIRRSSKLVPHLHVVAKLAVVESASSADDSSVSGVFFLSSQQTENFSAEWEYQ